MGAYESVEVTSCPPECPDLTGDCNVGVPDLLVLLSNWGPCPEPPADCPGDITGNGSVGVPDLLALLGGWGPCRSSLIWNPPQSVQDCWDRFYPDLEMIERCIEAVEQMEELLEEE